MDAVVVADSVAAIVTANVDAIVTVNNAVAGASGVGRTGNRGT